MNTASRKAWTVALAAVAWCGVLLQCVLSLQLAVQNGSTVWAGLENFLSYFTVLTNLLICASLTAAAFEPASALGRGLRRPSVIGGLAASIAFVGLSYHFLLRHTWNPQGAQLLADIMLHYTVPALYLLYWWFVAPRAALPWTSVLVWWAYPILYLGYALVRGAIVGSYPYPFIDAGALGYGRVLINGVALLLAFTSLGLIVTALSRVRAARIHRESA